MFRDAERTSFLAQTFEKEARQFLKDEGYEDDMGVKLEHIEFHADGASFGVFIEGLDILRVAVEFRGGEDFFFLRSIEAENAGTDDWKVQIQTNDPVALGLMIGALLRAHLMGERR